MKNEIETIITEKDIRDKIYVIRGKEVMLDSDLAELYHCKNGTKEINQAVRNNPLKFPERFSWVLQDNDVFYLRSKNLTANISNKSRSNPRVFTEQGVTMLATILKSKVAIDVSIKIMDAFVAMRHILIDNINYQKELFIMQNKIIDIDNKLIEHDSKFIELFSKFDSDDYLKDKLIFENHIYDAYSFLLDIFNTCKNGLIIIDNYLDKNTLDLICKLKVNVIVISKNMNEEHIHKYQTQYNNLTIIHNDSFHDRFIIIDKCKLYQLGSSLKDLGKKCSYISQIDKKEVLNGLLKTIKI